MAKIALFSYSCPEDIGGVTTWLVRFASFLRTQGYDTVCLLHHLGRPEATSTTHDKLSELGVRVEERERPEFMEDRVGSVLEFLAQESPQIFIPQCLFEGFYAGRIAGRAGLPWVMTLHSDEDDYWKPLVSVRPQDCLGSIVAVSKHIAARAKELSPRFPARLIPYGVSQSNQSAKNNPQTFRVVFNGRVVEHQKRISLVVATMIESCRLNPKVHATVIGDGGDLAAMKGKVAEVNLSERISFTGRLEPDEVRKELARAQAILMMSDFEGLPIALLESMSCGVVPVVRAIRSGIPELVRDGETGILVGADPKQAAQKISNLADDPEAWSRYSQAARKLFEDDYSDEVCFAKWRALIEEKALRSEEAGIVSIPRRWRLPDPILSKINPDVRRPPWWLRAYSSARINIGAFRRAAAGKG